MQMQGKGLQVASVLKGCFTVTLGSSGLERLASVLKGCITVTLGSSGLERLASVL